MDYFEKNLKLIAAENSITLSHLSKEYANLTSLRSQKYQIRTIWNESSQIRHLDSNEQLQNVWKSDREFESLFECAKYCLQKLNIQVDIQVIPASWFMTDYLFFISSKEVAFDLDVILDRFGCKDSLFYVGEMAGKVAAELVELRTPTAGEEMAVLLIDREVDLTGSCLSGTVLDILFSSGFDIYLELDDLLPPRSTPTNTVEEVEDALEQQHYGNFDYSSLHKHKVPLFTNEKADPMLMQSNIDRDQLDLIHAVISNPEKALETIQTRVYNLIGKVSPKISTPEQLKAALIENTTKKLLFKHEPEIKLLNCLINTLIQTDAKSTNLIGIERVLLATLQSGDYRYVLISLGNLLEAIITDKSTPSEQPKVLYSTRDVLILAFYVYSMMEQDKEELNLDLYDGEETRFLKSKFVAAMIASSPQVNRKAVQIWVEKAFLQIKKFAQLQSAKLDMIDSHQPLIKLIADGLVQPTSVPYKSLTSVLGRFIGKQKSFAEYKRVLVFFIGGVNMKEVLLCRQLFGGDCIIGSDGISGKDSIMQNVFKSK